MNRYRQRDAVAIASLPENHPFHTVSKRVTFLITIFFGLCITFFLLSIITDNHHPNSISIYVWGRAITEIVLGVAYFLFAYLWRRGKFWGYLRMLMTSALAMASTLSVVSLKGAYPWCLRLEQAIQFAVVAVLFILLTRPAMRARFRKKSPAEQVHTQK